MGIGIETKSTENTRRAGVASSVGSGGPVRGMQSSAEVNIDPGPAAILSLSGTVRVQTAEGPGGQTSITFQTPKISRPLDRIDLNA